MKKIAFIALLLMVFIITGCSLGNSPQSAYERAIFAAQAKIDLDQTADSTEKILNRYESSHARIQYNKLEADFAEKTALIASSDMDKERRARLMVQLYRQYGEQLRRLERELLSDAAKGDVVVQNIIRGGQNIEALQIAEELESAAEISYSEFVGDLIVRSGERVVFEVENIAAQKAADEALERRLDLLERVKDLEEEPVEEPVVEPVVE